MCQFHNSCARRSANILMAQCQDLGLEDIQPLANGEVVASLGSTDYWFRWNIDRQCIELVYRVDHDPMLTVTWKDAA